MDTLRCGVDLDRFPAPVRQDLMDVDRLRVIWAQHRQNQPRDVRTAARRELTRRHVRLLGGGPALEELLVSTSADGTSGQPITAAFVMELAALARTLPSEPSARSPRRTLGSEQALRLAETASEPTHPVVRAARTHAACVAVLRELDPDDVHAHTWALPWALSSLVLRRADFPPLPPGPLRPPWGDRDPQEHPAEVIRHFAKLVTQALLDELSWSPEHGAGERSPVSPLAAVTRRRVLDYVRSRRDSVALILRALDPEARTSVYSGGSDDSEPGSATEAVSESLLTPGAAHWWTALELAVDQASLCLYVVVQEVGRPRTGVLAVSAEARLSTPEGTHAAPSVSDTASVTVMPTDSADDRWPQVRDLVDEAVSLAMEELTRV